MGSGLVLANVTRNLQDSLRDWLRASPDDLASRAVEVSTLPPTRSAIGGDGLRVHLYLYRIGVNSALRNLPVGAAVLRGEPGNRTHEMQGLELDYLISVTPTRELDTERVLGAALDWAHQNPVMTVPVPVPESGAPAEPWQLRITLTDLTSEALAALCSASGGPYRAQLAIQVQVVRGATGGA